MHITTPHDVARRAGNKYLGVLVAAKFARYLNELPLGRLEFVNPTVWHCELS